MTPSGPFAPRRGGRAWNELRATWQARINRNGGWPCRRCNKRIPPNRPDAWDLGHPNDMTTGPTHTQDLAPEHTTCNRSGGATAGNQARTTPPPLPPSRAWHT